MKTTVTALEIDHPQEQPMRCFTHDGVAVEVHSCRENMGAAAARHAHAIIAKAVDEKGTCRVLVGCAPSQDDFFREMVRWAERLSELWQRVELFHMDDYVGLPASDPQSFRYYLRKHFLDHKTVGKVHLMGADKADLEAEIRRYDGLVSKMPMDLICLGFGDNGHLAFNDPPVADPDDPLSVKQVEMDADCRRQQVEDGCFATESAVPRSALTVTLSVFLRARHLCGIIPTKRKSGAVARALNGPIGTECPASFVRRHRSVRLFLDKDSASEL